VPQRHRWLSPLLGGLLLARASLGAPVPAPRAVVFVDPPSEDLARSLRDALTAQLSGGPASLVFDHFAEDPAPLRRHLSEAEALARAHAAAGVFWIDAQPDGDWLLYLSEPDGERTLVRRVEVEANGAAAAVEAVALITRQSTEALLAGGTVGMQPVNDSSIPRSATPVPRTPEPEPELAAPAPTPEQNKKRGVRSLSGPSFSAAYAGEYPAKALGWQNGLAVSGGYRFAVGIYVAAGYTFFRDAEVDVPPLILRITRNPFYLEGGYAFGRGRWVPSIGGRVIMEPLGRHTLSTSGAFAGTPDSTRVGVLLSPRVRVEYVLSAALAVYGTVGADFGLNRFSFVSRVGDTNRVLLEPDIVRPAIELGLSFSP